jgi:DNA-binding LytR/AlgR family response regulator
MFLTDGKSLMVNLRLWRIEEILQEHPNFVRINRSEIVNLDAVDGFEGNCYYIGKNPLYATGDYRQRM